MMNDILTTLTNRRNFTTLRAALVATHLDEALLHTDSLTLFAPDDVAFGHLPDAVFATLMHDRGELARLLTTHLIPRRLRAADFFWLQALETMAGTPLPVWVDGSCIQLNHKARVTTPNIECTNGVVHVVDHVLWSQNASLAAA
ncbi:MAG: fasciclin domain-containing protein [Blastocatellia bacterium]